MCGIAGFYFHNPENCPLTAPSIERLINELLEGIEHRGYDATGVAAIGAASGTLHIEKADTWASNFNYWRNSLPETPRSVLLHTRFATKGTPMNLDNNHPIRYNNVVMTHNGHINNDDDIFSNEALSRNAEVDSEAIAAIFDKYGIDKAHIPLGKLEGNMAVAVCDLRKPNTLVLAKGVSSPLHYYEAEEGIMWASEKDVIIDAAYKALGMVIEKKDLRELYWGKLLLIENGEVERLDFKPYTKPYKAPATAPVSRYYDEQAWAGKVTETDDEDDSDDSENYASWHKRFFSRLIKHKNQEKEVEVEEIVEETIPSEDLVLYDNDLAHVAFWEKEPHDIAYSINTSNGKRFIFKECDGCDTAYQTKLLTIVDGGYILCSYCVDEYDAQAETKEENPAVVHDVAVELVAEKFATNPDFVHWLVFESDDDDIEDGDSHLVSLYIQFSEEYDKVYKELTGEQFGNALTLARIATEKDDEEDEDELIGCGVMVFEEDVAAIEGVI